MEAITWIKLGIHYHKETKVMSRFWHEFDELLITWAPLYDGGFTVKFSYGIVGHVS